MKRLISTKDCESYSRLLKPIEKFELGHGYKWLITDIEAYPRNPDLDLKLAYSEYIICTKEELLSWLKEEDFQWVWGVLSLFGPEIKEDDILKYELPGNGDEHPRPHLFDDNKPIIQHPLAILELDADDSSFLAISSKEDKYVEIFKKIYPKSTENI